MNNIKNSRAKPNSSANFAGIDINYLVAKVRNGSATREEFQMLASFCGTYLQKWQVFDDLLKAGIIITSAPTLS
ncbi:MAG TPA: hypothetical protein DEO49_08775 [Sutterella sp.]|nr:hypothetical protein [Sutterella sp.]